ncbi:MAG: transposase, partial [Symploca sp. SIO2E9]|nr:transposase [Symploca sp. SIO2E9]NEP00344.1 transposase [Symploca sp. SIO2E9]NEP03247.1 transposase [Symploca sp. SIO2E9]
MLVYETKLKGNQHQYERLNEAIRTGLFIRNSCLRFWEDGNAKSRYDLYKYVTRLAKDTDFPWAKKLNSQAR